MIINGGSRQNFRFFATHLMRTDQNQRVEIREMRGVFGGTLLEALREMDAVASGSRTENFMYHANLNPSEGEELTAQQWQDAVDRLERNLGLEGHARVVVEHEKDGRTHQHVIWNRIDPDTMTAASDSFNYRRHEQTAREIEEAFGLAHVDSVLVKDRGTPRPQRTPKDYETFRAQKTKIDPKAVQAELTALWQEADSGLAFKAAVEEAGYILARGDRSGFMVIDAAGDDHALGRRLDKVRKADVDARMADVDRDALPSVAEGRALARAAADAAGNAEPPTAPDAAPEPQAASPTPQAAADYQHPPRPSATPQGGQERAELAYLAPEPQLTDGIARDLAERFGDFPPLASGRDAAFAPLASAAPADLPPLEPATAPDISDEHTGWRRFADRVRGLAARAAELLHDESSGGQDGRGVVARILSMGRKVASGMKRHDAQELNEGLAEGADIAAAELAKKTAETPTSSPKTWVERVLAEGLHKARDLLHQERGSGPGFGLAHPQGDFEGLAEEWAAGIDTGGDSGPEPPGTDAQYDDDMPQPDGPDGSDWDITP